MSSGEAMSALDKKLFRDLIHIWGQALAIALVLACGVATLLLGVGAYRSLYETREAYYERYRFAHIFATAKRAPDHLKAELSEIPGVATVETRIMSGTLLDIEGMAKPASGLVISLPKHGSPLLNALFLRSGRLPEPNREDEIVVNENFAKAHDFTPGSTLKAILNGRKRHLKIVGLVLSPEFIYAIGPGDLIPDDRRFGVLWMTQSAAEAAYDLKGAFNFASLRLRRDASEKAIIERVDAILERYGGRGAYTRKDQSSHAFLDAELKQLRGMSQILPPIFLGVAAFLINITLARLIATEREQIGLLKALGYGQISIAGHYLKFVLIITIIGIGIGFGAGVWLGRGLTRLYGEFYHFPFLVFLNTLDIFIIAAGVSIAAAILGALRSVFKVMALSPAVAMSPPAPTRYGHMWLEGLGIYKHLPQSLMMVLRHLMRWPLRAAFTLLGISLSCALLVASLFTDDSVEFMIDVTFFQVTRQDAQVEFSEIRPERTAIELNRLPGVLSVEPHRNVAAILRFGHKNRRTSITGIHPGTDLRQLLDPDLQPMVLPKTGVIISDKLSELLGVGIGETLVIQIMDGSQPTIKMPVVARIQGYLGLQAYMDLDTLNGLLGDGRVITGASLAIDRKKENTLYRELKSLPIVSSIALLKASLKNFRKTLAENIVIMTTVYLVLAVTITFGVVYNSARIHLSERGRELASLRVLGFTRTEVSFILLTELALLVVLAIPLGWLIGYGMAWSIITQLDNELYRVPMVIESQTYAMAALITIGAATLSALIVRRRIDRLDLIKVLKTRE